MKLFFIGEGGRGKTTLKKRLSHPSMSAKEIKKETSSTIGVDVEIWEYKPDTPGKEVVKFLTWDFAGQVSTHNILPLLAIIYNPMTTIKWPNFTHRMTTTQHTNAFIQGDLFILHFSVLLMVLPELKSLHLGSKMLRYNM